MGLHAREPGRCRGIDNLAKERGAGLLHRQSVSGCGRRTFPSRGAWGRRARGRGPWFSTDDGNLVPGPWWGNGQGHKEIRNWGTGAIGLWAGGGHVSKGRGWVCTEPRTPGGAGGGRRPFLPRPSFGIGVSLPRRGPNHGGEAAYLHDAHAVSRRERFGCRVLPEPAPIAEHPRPSLACRHHTLLPPHPLHARRDWTVHRPDGRDADGEREGP